MKSVVFGYVPSNFTSQNFSSALAVGSSNVDALQRSVVIALVAATVVSIGIRLYVGGLAQIHGTLVDAARVQGAGIWRTLVLIVFPLLRRQVGSIWMLVFTGTMFELAAAELLYPPGQPTMPVMILTLLGNFQTGIAMALTLMSIGVLAAALIIARGVFWLFSLLIWKRRSTPQIGLMVENVDTPTLEAQAHA